MIETLGKHASFILAAYGVAFVVLGAMIGFSLHKATSARKQLASLKNMGVTLRDND